MFLCTKKSHLRLPVGTEDGATSLFTMSHASLDGNTMNEGRAQRRTLCVHCFYAAVSSLTVVEVKQAMDDLAFLCLQPVSIYGVGSTGAGSREASCTMSIVEARQQTTLSSADGIVMQEELIASLATSLLRHVGRLSYNTPCTDLITTLNTLLCRLFDLFASAPSTTATHHRPYVTATLTPAEPCTTVRLLGEEPPCTGSTPDEHVSCARDDHTTSRMPLTVSPTSFPSSPAAGLLRSMVDLLQEVLRDGERHEVVFLLLRLCDLSVHCDGFLRTAGYLVEPLLTLFKRSIAQHMQSCHVVELLLFLTHRLLCVSKQDAALLDRLAITISDGCAGEVNDDNGDFVTTLCLTLTQHVTSEAVLCNALAVLDSALASDTILCRLLLCQTTQPVPVTHECRPADLSRATVLTTRLLQLLAPLLLHGGEDVRLVACGCIRCLVVFVTTHEQRLPWRLLDWMSDYAMEALQRVSEATAMTVVELLIALCRHEALLVDDASPRPDGEGAPTCGSGVARLQVFWRLAEVPGAAFERLVESPCFERVVRQESSSLNVIANGVLRTASLHPGMSLRCFLTQLDVVTRVAQRSEALLPEIVDTIARAVTDRVIGGAIATSAGRGNATCTNCNTSQDTTSTTASSVTLHCLDGLGAPSTRLLFRIVAFLVDASEVVRPLATQLLYSLHRAVVATRQACAAEIDYAESQYRGEEEGMTGAAIFTALLPLYDPVTVLGEGWQRCFGQLLRDGVVDTLLALAASSDRSPSDLTCRLLYALLQRVFGVDGAGDGSARASVELFSNVCSNATVWDCSRAAVLGCTNAGLQSRLLVALASLKCPAAVSPAELAGAVYAQMQTLLSSLSTARTHDNHEACSSHCLLLVPLPTSSLSSIPVVPTGCDGQLQCILQKAQCEVRRFIELAASFVLWFGDLTTMPAVADERTILTMQAAASIPCMVMLHYAPLRAMITSLLDTLYAQVGVDVGVVVDALLRCSWTAVCAATVLIALLLFLPDEREERVLRCVCSLNDDDDGDADDDSATGVEVVADGAVPERTLCTVCQVWMSRWLRCAFGTASVAAIQDDNTSVQPVFLELAMQWVRCCLEDRDMGAAQVGVGLLHRLVYWWHVLRTPVVAKEGDVAWLCVATQLLRRHIAPLLLHLMDRTVDAALSAAVASLVALPLSLLPATACSEVDGRILRWLLHCFSSLPASQVSPYLVHVACLLLERCQSTAIVSRHGATITAHMTEIQRCTMHHNNAAQHSDMSGGAPGNRGANKGDDFSGDDTVNVGEATPCAAMADAEIGAMEEVLKVVLCGLVLRNVDVAVSMLDGSQHIATRQKGVRAWCVRLPVTWLTVRVRGLREGDRCRCRSLILRALDVWLAPMRRLPLATEAELRPTHPCRDDETVYSSVCCVLDWCLEELVHSQRACVCPAGRVIFALIHHYRDTVNTAVEVAAVFALCRRPASSRVAGAPSVVADVVSRGWVLAALLSSAPYVPWLNQPDDVATTVQAYLNSAEPPATVEAQPGRCGDERSTEEMARTLISACDAFSAWTGHAPFASHRFHDLFCRQRAECCALRTSPYTVCEAYHVLLPALRCHLSETPQRGETDRVTGDASKFRFSDRTP